MNKRVGSYVGHMEVVKIENGHYRVTGPRGSCEIRRAIEPVRVVSWANNRGTTRKRTVWTIDNQTKDGGPWHDILQNWDFTLKAAIDRCMPAVCFYRNL